MFDKMHLFPQFAKTCFFKKLLQLLGMTVKGYDTETLPTNPGRSNIHHSLSHVTSLTQSCVSVSEITHMPWGPIIQETIIHNPAVCYQTDGYSPQSHRGPIK